MQIDEEKSLDLLRKIFLSESNAKIEDFEKELENLKYRLTNKESFIESYFPLITDLIKRKIDSNEKEVTDVLSPLMSKALLQQIQESKEDIIDALYPIMGETIRRSISEGIKEIYASINLKIDKALRRGIFSKQIKAKLAGVSASDLILKESFPFEIKEVFLIHENTGLLITHFSTENNKQNTDSDIISGMLTAIKDFVAESFKTDNGVERLHEIQYGDSKIVLERGLYSYLAVVFSGNEPANFNYELGKLNTEIHKKYHKSLREFDGKLNDFENLSIPFEDFIYSFKNELPDKDIEQPKPALGYLLFGILAIVLIIIGIINIPQYLENRRINNEINDKLSEISEVNLDKISWDTSNEKIIFSGSVPSFILRSRIDSALNTITGIKNIENNIQIVHQVLSPDSIMLLINTKLSQFNLEKIKYQLIGGKIFLSGEAENEDQRLIVGDVIANVPGVSVVINNIIPKKQYISALTKLEELLGELHLDFYFGKTDLSESNKNQLDIVIPLLEKVKNKVILITGYSDNKGNTETNLLIAKKRANAVGKYLEAKSIPQAIMEFDSKISNNQKRYVKIKLVD